LPSTFLKRRREKTNSTKGKGKLFQYERDIVLLPKSYESMSGSIKIPRAHDSWEFLARNGLMGKICLSSSMSESEIMTESFSVFRHAMRDDPNFPFIILQQAGGSSRSLVKPSLSASFRWTASSSVAGQNVKVPIYILAGADLKVGLS